MKKITNVSKCRY